MLINYWLKAASTRLQAAGIQTARLDSIVLLEDVLRHDRAWILAHDDTEVTREQSEQLEALLSRRETHEPLAYIRGSVEFYGRQFTVTPNVLVPRPESESLIDIAKILGATKALDVGTGSGCLGITLKLERPDIAVMLSDIDPAALAVALRNAQRLGADVTALQSDLLGSTIGKFDLLVANLPYVPDDHPVNQAATHEPRLALFSGQDGLDHYRRLWHQCVAAQPRWVVTESMPQQHADMARIAERAGFALTRADGYAQLFEKA